MISSKSYTGAFYLSTCINIAVAKKSLNMR